MTPCGVSIASNQGCEKTCKEGLSSRLELVLFLSMMIVNFMCCLQQSLMLFANIIHDLIKLICLIFQEVESEYNLATMVEMSSSVPKADPSQFELLKVLGQGSFGKVGPLL